MTPAQQFLEALAKNTSFAQAFYQELEKIYNTAAPGEAAGQSPSAIANYANSTLTAWLRQQGYNTTPTAIVQTFKQIAETQLRFWIGIYGSTWGSNSDWAPVLAIVLDHNQNPVPQLCGVPLINYTFSDRTLSWSSADGNTTSGSVTFTYTSPITLYATPPTGYTGPWFQGKLTLTLPSGQTQTDDYYGELATPVSFPLLNWSGNYGITNYGSEDANQSPSLCIQGTTPENIQVYLDQVRITNWTYNCALNKLTWTTNGGNNSTASISFYQATASSSSPYTGSAFQGTLSLSIGGQPATPQSFTGILCQPQALADFVGCYGMTVIIPLDNPSATPMLGPQLNITVNNNTPQIEMDFGNGVTTQIPIDNFDAQVNLLRWTASSPIGTTGEIQFGNQTQATAASSYIGNFFNGKLFITQRVSGLPFGNFSYSGEVGQYCYTASSLTVIQVLEQGAQQVTNLMIQMYLQEQAIKGIKQIYSWTKDVFQKMFQTSTEMEQELTTAKGIADEFTADAAGDTAGDVAGDAAGDAAADAAGDAAADVAADAAGDATLDIVGDILLGLICF